MKKHCGKKKHSGGRQNELKNGFVLTSDIIDPLSSSVKQGAVRIKCNQECNASGTD
jgi:hypothetical protein